MAKLTIDIGINTEKISSDIKKVEQALNGIKEKASQIKFDPSLIKGIESVVKAYQEFNISLDKVVQNYDKLAQKGSTTTERLSKHATELQTKFYRIIKSINDNIDKYSQGTFSNLENRMRMISSLVNSYKKGIADGTITTKDELTPRLLQDIQAEYQKIIATTKTLNQEKKSLISTEKQETSTTQELTKAVSQEGATETKNVKTFNQTKDALTRLNTQYSNLLTRLKNLKHAYPAGTFDELENEINNTRTEFGKFKDSVIASGDVADDTQEKYDGFKSKQIELQDALSRTTAEVKKNENAVVQNGDSVVKLAQKFLVWQLAATAVMQPIYKIREALEKLNETLVKVENTVIEIQRVVNETISDEHITRNLYEIAQQYGQTFDNVADIATKFAKTGMTWAETIEATRAAVLALNVAELDAEQASEGLIAVMTQFGYQAKDLTNIIDVLNKQADNAAVTTEELLIGLQKTGSYAKAANLSLEETVALITTLSETTAASGSTMGNAIRSLLAYTTKEKALDTFSGLSDTMKNLVAQYRLGAASILDIWKELSIEIDTLGKEQAEKLNLYFSEEGSELESELENELNDIYGDITDVYNTAGTFRKNYFVALLSDLDTVEEKINLVSDSTGYSLQENEKYLETYQAKVNSLNASWEEFLNSEQDWLGFKKGLVEMASGILRIVDAMGGLKGVLTIIGTLISSLALGKLLESLPKIPILMNKIKTSLKDGIGWLNHYKRAKELAAQAEQLHTQAKKDGIYATELEEQANRLDAMAKRENEIATKTLTSAISTLMTVVTSVALVVELVVLPIIQHYKKEQEAIIKQAEDTVDAWSMMNDEYNNLAKLYGQLINLQNGNEDLTEIEKQLVDVLGDKANALKELTVGTEEYTKALTQLTKAEMEELATQAGEATSAAETTLRNQMKKNTTISTGSNKYLTEEESATYRAITDIMDTMFYGKKRSEMTYSEGLTNNLAYYNLGNAKKDNVLDIYAKALNATKKIEALATSEMEQYRTTGEISHYEEAQRIYQNGIYLGFKKFITDNQEQIENLIKSTTQNLAYTYKVGDEDGIVTQGEFDNVFNQIQEALDTEGDYSDLISNYLHEILDVTKEIKDGVKLSLGKMRWTTLKDWLTTSMGEEHAAELVSYLKSIKETNDIEAEKLEMIEAINQAQLDLETAQKEKTIRVYNEGTGQWEWQADAKKVQTAQEKLSDATVKFQEWFTTKAWDDLLNNINENTTGKEIIDIIAKWSESYGEHFDGDFEFKDLVTDGLSKYFGEKSDLALTITEIKDLVAADKDREITDTELMYMTQSPVVQGALDIGKSIVQGATGNAGDKISAGLNIVNSLVNLFKKKTYDEGGILNGLGGIKATNQPETVLSPSLTKQILEPSSNAAFSEFAQSLGLLFGVSKQLVDTTTESKFSGNNQTYNTGNSYTINGMTISESAANEYSIVELFKNMALV